MKTIKNYLALSVALLTLVACSKTDDHPVANTVHLTFSNTFNDQPIVLGDANSPDATVHISAKEQKHSFSEIKYVISNIRLIKTDGSEFPYHINDLDRGAHVVNQAQPQTLDFSLEDIPAGEYKQIRLGLGVRSDLNTLDEARFPNFYAKAGANDTQMMWEWGAGYRFVKLEGFYGDDNKPLSIHTGSTIEGEEGAYTQGVDAYREIALDLGTSIAVGSNGPRVTIQADFDKLLSGKTHTLTLSTGNGPDDNATPNAHTAIQMLKFVDNMGGNGENDLSGMFSVQRIENE